jgi:hypothetical protein
MRAQYATDRDCLLWALEHGRPDVKREARIRLDALDEVMRLDAARIGTEIRTDADFNLTIAQAWNVDTSDARDGGWEDQSVRRRIMVAAIKAATGEDASHMSHDELRGAYDGLPIPDRSETKTDSTTPTRSTSMSESKIDKARREMRERNVILSAGDNQHEAARLLAAHRQRNVVEPIDIVQRRHDAKQKTEEQLDKEAGRPFAKSTGSDAIEKARKRNEFIQRNRWRMSDAEIRRLQNQWSLEDLDEDNGPSAA